MFSSMISLAGSEWSFAQFKLENDDISERGTKAVCGKGYLHVLTKKGKYFRAKISDQGGVLVKEDEESLLNWWLISHVNLEEH